MGSEGYVAVIDDFYGGFDLRVGCGGYTANATVGVCRREMENNRGERESSGGDESGDSIRIQKISL